MERPLGKKVTYHDPCYLGRHNGVYEAPRKVLGALPGVELVEMGNNRSGSLCCGGGGGRVWMDDVKCDEKMSEIRVKEACATGAEVLVTACPLCLIMLEDGRKTAELADRVEVMDLAELVAKALPEESPSTD